MLIRSLHWLAFLVTLSTGLLACTSSRPAASIADIENVGNRLWAAHEQGDAAALADLVTDDAVLMVPGFPDVRGRDAIRAAADGMFKTTRIENFKIKRREIRVVGDEAYELAWYSEVMRPQQGEPRHLDGRYLIVWKRDAAGHWLVHRNLFNFANAEGH